MSDPWFGIFDADSSSSDVDHIIYYLNSLAVLEKEVRRDLGIAKFVEEMKQSLQFAVSSRN